MPKQWEPMNQMEYWNIASTSLDNVVPVPMWEGVKDWDLLDDEIQTFCYTYSWIDA